jgi:energy-coupling factor transport system ATP-binding protein
MVSHSMSDVARITDRLLVMNNAHLAMDGMPDQVFLRSTELVEMGLDIPDVTRIFMRLRQLGLSVPVVYSVEQAVAQLKLIKEGTEHA